jgi:HEAT repeat protein
MKKIIITLLVVSASVISVLAADAPKDAKKADKTAVEYVADLSSSDEATVIAAEDWIGQKKEKTAKDKLLDLLKSDNRELVRINAAVALSLIADKTTAEPISGFILEESSADVRYAEALAVFRIGVDSKKAIDNLKAAREKETDPYIKDLVAKMEEKLKTK